jgi:hypothetical protein
MTRPPTFDEVQDQQHQHHGRSARVSTKQVHQRLRLIACHIGARISGCSCYAMSCVMLLAYNAAFPSISERTSVPNPPAWLLEPLPADLADM